MSNFREANNDILKEWFDYGEDTYFAIQMNKIKNMKLILKR